MHISLFIAHLGECSIKIWKKYVEFEKKSRYVFLHIQDPYPDLGFTWILNTGY